MRFFTLFTHEKTESVLNFRSDSLTQSECAVHSRTLKADLIISFHIFFFLCFFQVCAVMLQLYPCLFSLQNQILIELKWEILSYWYAKWRIWVSWSAASELSLKLYLISPLYNLCSNCWKMMIVFLWISISSENSVAFIYGPLVENLLEILIFVQTQCPKYIVLCTIYM